MPLVDHPAYREEQARLERTLNVIGKEHAAATRELEDARIALNAARRSDPDNLPIREMLYARAHQSERNLAAAAGKPYFTRIDFTEKGCDPATWYIGRHGVSHSDTLEIEVVDWRAPVANLYYSGQIGPLKYSSPDGDVEGELTLKRQFTIEEGSLKGIFDIDIVAQDQYLRDALSAAGGDRLRDIVTTIQAEQNYVIRYPLEKDLVVQGVAGSGKTTIALHRISYLLYTYADRLRPEQMGIIAPSPLFLNFISGVLPDLGVEHVYQSTFTRFLGDVVGSYAACSANRTEPPGEVLLRKGSLSQMDLLDRWLDDFEDRFPPEEDLRFGPLTIFRAEELRKFLLEDERPFPLRRRLKELRKQLKSRTQIAVKRLSEWYTAECDKRIMTLKQRYTQKEDRTQAALKLQKSLRDRLGQITAAGAAYPDEVLKRFPALDPTDLYRRFLEDRAAAPDAAEADRLAAEAAQNRTRFAREDLAAIAVIALRVLELKKPDLRHIVVDEAQDLSSFEFALLKRICPGASFTLVGDLMQGITGAHGLADWSPVTDRILKGTCRMHSLVTSYRSTVEIMEPAIRVMRHMPIPGLKEAKPVLRHGPTPVIAEGGFTEAAALAEQWHSEGLATVAIIHRDRRLLSRLSKKTGWPILDPEAEEYPVGILLAPSDTVKGLEFDGVILLDASEEQWPAAARDARLLYVCLTRALHREAIFRTGALTPLLEETDGDPVL